MVLVCRYFNKYVNFGPYCEVRVVALLDFVILECTAITGTAYKNGKMYVVAGSRLLHSATALSMVLSNETSANASCYFA
jgi:predicted anti-sigma-YlaC factor YlaD